MKILKSPNFNEILNFIIIFKMNNVKDNKFKLLTFSKYNMFFLTINVSYWWCPKHLASQFIWET